MKQDGVKWEKFFITVKDQTTNQIYLDEVLGEEVFMYRGYRFFVRFADPYFVVSDVRCGLVMVSDGDLGHAVEKAMKKVSEKYPDYIKSMKKHVRECRIKKVST